MKSIKGDAEVNVRKGKKLVTYDYNLKLGWKLELFEKGDSDGNGKVVSVCEGTYEFPEISNDEEEDGWECYISWSQDKDNLQNVFN